MISLSPTGYATGKQLGLSAKRELSKINYRIHTDAIKYNLIPDKITKAQSSIIYANEADVLNVAMFGMTAKQRRDANPELKGDIRDYATINELICLSNMENLNAVFIEQGMPQSERLKKLDEIAIHQIALAQKRGYRLSYSLKLKILPTTKIRNFYETLEKKRVKKPRNISR